MQPVLVNLIAALIGALTGAGALWIATRALFRFEVRDNGIGVAPERLPSPFQPFVQADSSTTRHYGGTGLGLSIVRRLVEMMGGEVGAHSEPGKGSTFWFVLPLEPVVSAKPHSPQSSIDGPENKRADAERRFAGNVLLIEDNAVNQKVAVRLLERMGCSVRVADNGAEGVRAWSEGSFDLVLMDLQMPVMDGHGDASHSRAGSRPQTDSDRRADGERNGRSAGTMSGVRNERRADEAAACRAAA